MKDKMSSYFVTIRGYKIKEEDIQSEKHIQIPAYPYEPRPTCIDYLKVERKYMHVLESPLEQENYLVVKTVESFIGDWGGNKSIIKALRVFDP